MSYQETVKGKVKKLNFNGLPIEDQMKQLLDANGVEYDSDYIADDFSDAFYRKKYLVHKGEVYEILEIKPMQPSGFLLAEFTGPDEIEFFVSWYNGGASFDEAVGYAIEKASPYKPDEKLKQQAHRAAEESAKDAHRRGWEQAKREAVGYLRYQHNLVVGEASLDYLATLEQCWSAIASIEYKEGK